MVFFTILVDVDKQKYNLTRKTLLLIINLNTNPFPMLCVSLTGLSNPPSKPTIEELPIANTFTNPHRVTLHFAWQPPHYTGGLSTLLYNISYNAAHRTIETLCSNISEAVGYTEYAMTVAVEVATVGTISRNVCPDIASEKASFSKFLNPVCINEGGF